MFKGHLTEITALSISKDGQTLASVSKDGNLKIWNTSSTKMLKTIPTKMKSAHLVSLSSNGAYVAASSDEEQTLKIWEAASGKLLKTVRIKDFQITSFSPDDKHLVFDLGESVFLLDMSALTAPVFYEKGPSELKSTITNTQKNTLILQPTEGKIPPDGTHATLYRNIEKKVKGSLVTIWLEAASVTVISADQEKILVEIKEVSSEIPAKKKDAYFAPKNNMILTWEDPE